MSSSCGFGVTIKRREVVAAVLPEQKYWLPMSNLDLLIPPLDVGVFFCYKKNTIPHQNMATIVKKALAQVLVSFYAFAGEVVQNNLGEPELLCNNRGVDFLQAYADVELKDLDLHHPDDSVHGNLVPIKKQGVLSVQVTELKCGGFVIGCRFDHRVADAHSANMFFVAWAEIAKARSISQSHIPYFRRSMLNPRRPIQYDASIDNMYVLRPSLPTNPTEAQVKAPAPGSGGGEQLQSRIYYVRGEEIDRLQACASSNSNGCRRSKLESFSAFLWKIIAEGGSDDSKRCKMGIVVDGRKRLLNGSLLIRSAGGDGDGDKSSPTMQNYFGNVLSVPYGEASVGEVKALPLSQVADLVHACLEGAAKEEHFLGLIDWVELHRPEQAIVKVYCKDKNDEAAVVVSSGHLFPVSKMDFGWGTSDFGSYIFPWGGLTGYVMPMPSVSRDGDWVVYVHLLNKHLNLLDTNAAHLFRPLTPTYLKI